MILSSAPDLTVINAHLREIEKKREQGRAAKKSNKWDEKWEAGVVCLKEAFSSLQDLEEKMETYRIKAHQISSTKKQFHLSNKAIGISLITFFIGIAVTILVINTRFIGWINSIFK
jgi:hypothetical protein